MENPFIKYNEEIIRFWPYADLVLLVILLIPLLSNPLINRKKEAKRKFVENLNAQIEMELRYLDFYEEVILKNYNTKLEINLQMVGTKLKEVEEMITSQDEIIWLLYITTKDKLFNTKETEVYMDSILTKELEPIFDDLSGFALSYFNEIQGTLDQRQSLFFERCNSVSKRIIVEHRINQNFRLVNDYEKEEFLKTCKYELDKLRIGEIETWKGVESIVTPILKSCATGMGKIAQLLLRRVSKKVKSAAYKSSIAMVLDGPLPFGDLYGLAKTLYG